MDYQKQAAEFIAAHQIDFRAVLVGGDCPAFCEDAEKENAMDQTDTYPRKTHIHGKHYRCTFSAKGRGHLTVDFWNSYSDEEYNYLLKRAYGQPGSFIPDQLFLRHGFKESGLGWRRPLEQNGPKIPTPYDVLACIQKNDVGAFEDFCGDFGYNVDSRKAESVYQAVCREWRKVRSFFTAEELQQAQEIH